MSKIDKGACAMPPKKKIIKPPLRPIKTLSRLVQGTIFDQTSAPRVGLTIKAFDRNLGIADTLLGQATTDQKGHYLIAYTAKQLKGKAAADLVVSVYQAGQLLQTVEDIFNAPPDAILDFIIPVTRVPEFQEIFTKVQPLMNP
jgi:hypothetical protein